MKYSKELIAFKEHFEKHTGIKVVKCIENKEFFHWKRLQIDSLNCEELDKISQYIKKFFSEQGRYTHFLPTVGVFTCLLCITIDESLIKQFIIPNLKYNKTKS